MFSALKNPLKMFSSLKKLSFVKEFITTVENRINRNIENKIFEYHILSFFRHFD
jgi:hypothetical protein